MNRYVENIGEVAKLPSKVVKQFHADTSEQSGGGI